MILASQDTEEFYAISTIFIQLSSHFEINYFIFVFFLDTICFIIISSGEFGLPRLASALPLARLLFIYCTDI
jgi:hypothetical protein